MANGRVAGLLAVVAVVAAGVGFGAGLVVGGGEDEDRGEPPAPANPPMDDAPEPARPKARDGGRRDAQAKATGDLGAGPDEVAFLRDALARERVRRKEAVILPGDTGIDIVRRAVEHDADTLALLRDHAAARAHVRDSTGTSHRIEAPEGALTIDVRALPKDAEVLEFGPGTFRLEHTLRDRLGADVESLEIRGAGMDSTLLIVPDYWITVMKSLEHLVIRDVTLQGNERRALSVQVSGSAGVALDRVRILRWDSGGHSSALACAGNVYLVATECEFLGDGDEGGGLGLSVRGKCVALFEKCRFEDVRLAIRGWEGAAVGSAVRYAGCTFMRTRLTDGDLEYPVEVQGGTVGFSHDGRTEEARRTEWGEPYAASVEEVVFAPEEPRCSVAKLLEVIESSPLETGERVTFAGLAGRTGFRAHMYAVTIQKPGRRKKVGVLDAGGALSPAKAPDARRPTLPGTDRLKGAMSIPDVVRASGLPTDLPAVVANYHLHRDGKQETLVIRLGDGRWGGREWLLDAANGRVIKKPVDPRKR